MILHMRSACGIIGIYRKKGRNDDGKLSDAQLSALFANLSKGCEKQYKPEEAELLKTVRLLPGKSGTLPGTLGDVEALVRSDLAAYASAHDRRRPR